MEIPPGALLAYRNKCAFAVAADGEKIEISIEGGASARVRLKDVTLLHPGPVKAIPEPAPLGNPDEVAELIGDECVPFSEFVELMAGEFSPGAARAVWGVLAENLRFTGSAESGVTVRPAGEVAAMLAAREAKQAARDQRAALIDRLKRGEIDLTADRPALREIELFAKGEATACPLLRELGIEATPEAAHRLLLRFGVWDEWTDPLPFRSGLELAEPAVPVARALPGERWDLTALEAWAIDDVGSEDPDDALSFADGLLYVHVADVSSLVRPDSELDVAACRRGSTLYLPEKIVTMLPGAMTPLLGLGLSEESPAFTFAIRPLPDGEMELVKFGPSRVRVRRTTYDAAEPLLGGGIFREISDALAPFVAKRNAAGSVNLDFPEVKLKVSGQSLEMTPIPRLASRRLVESTMIAAGYAVARYGAAHELPLPYVVQSAGERDLTRKADSYPAMFEIRAASAPGVLSAFPDPHAGLGLPCYVRVTSPLRRYCDLLAHQQLRRVLGGGEPFSADDLESRFVWCEPASRERVQLERAVNNYWLLVWFSHQDPARRYRAVKLGSAFEKQVYLLPETGYFYRCRYGASEAPGTEFFATVSAVDLADQTINFRMEREP